MRTDFEVSNGTAPSLLFRRRKSSKLPAKSQTNGKILPTIVPALEEGGLVIF
jgi:hypothetical protein